MFTTARITRKFPTVAMNAMRAEQEAVEKDKYVGAGGCHTDTFQREAFFVFPNSQQPRWSKKRAAKFQNTKFSRRDSVSTLGVATFGR